MLKVLLKKQLAEVFRSYFYDAKKNKMRSKLAIAGWFIFFIAIMVVLLGGIFTAVSFGLCGALTNAGMDWLYFLLMSGIAIVIGAFGSVFNTYSSLYLAKDNDLLLSMPIPVRTIVAARLANVYLMGSMYVATVFLPALIVYWAVAGVNIARVICGIVLLLVITVIVLFLSCLLGWVVAKLSLKLKNKSFFTVFLSLLFIGGYYFLYFRATDLILNITLNASIYGEKIQGAAYGLYLFGQTGTGNWTATAIVTAITAALGVLLWTLLRRSFLSIATASGKAGKVRYTEKKIKQKTVFGALLGKEFARFTSSPNYMLNCGLSTLLIPVFGVLLLIKGQELCAFINMYFADKPDCAALMVCAALCLLVSMNDIAVPSVSLEGKSLWIPQSMPIAPKTILYAKAAVQLLLTMIPMLLTLICAVAVLEASPVVNLLLCVFSFSYTVFSSLFATVIGVKMPLLNWTSELVPIKQSGSIFLVLFGSVIVCTAFTVLYLFLAYQIGIVLYLLLWSVLSIIGGLIALRWLNTKGANTFAAL